MKNIRVKTSLLILVVIATGTLFACTPKVSIEELEVARNEAALLGERLAVGGIAVVGLCDDGTVVGSDAVDPVIGEWGDVVDISVVSGDCVGTKQDGSVLRTPYDPKYYTLDTSFWSDVTSVLATDGTIVGLTNDGTVVATGNNESGQCEVDEWTEVDKICGNGANTIGIKNNGTVLLTGYSVQMNEKVISEWTDVVDVVAEASSVAADADDNNIFYLTEDGRMKEMGGGRAFENLPYLWSLW